MRSEMKGPKKNVTGPARGVDLGEVERILEFMKEHGLEEFDYAKGDLRIRLRKPVAGSVMALPGRAPDIIVAGNTPAAPPAEVAAAEAAAEEAALAEGLHLIKSPIVGTFYEGPSPGAPPFVKVGDHVAPGQVLCIIEAMKMMNQIESERAGKVVAAFAKNGEPVEFGQPLFAIE